MTGDARFVTGAVGFLGTALGKGPSHGRAAGRRTAATERRLNRFGPTLLLALALIVVTQVPEAADSIRTVDVRLSRYAFAPEHIEVRLGERVRLNLVSLDRAHGFRVKELGLNTHVPAGASVTLELRPTQPGTFEITCSVYCGVGHGRMKASLIVRPGP
jgi:cytochrome c oxidase subunit 2